MKKAEIIAKYGEDAYEQQLTRQREYKKGWTYKNCGCKPKWDFSGCTTKYDRMKKMNLFVEYSAPKDELMPEISGKIDIFQIGECRDRIYLTVSIVNGRNVVWAYDKESGKQFKIHVYEIIYLSEFGDVPDGWSIHHIDGNPLNDHPHNLVAMPQSDHARYHRLKDRNKANEILNKYRRAQRMWQ